MTPITKGKSSCTVRHRELAISMVPLCLPRRSRRSVSGRVEAVELEPNPDDQRTGIEKFDVLGLDSRLSSVQKMYNF